MANQTIGAASSTVSSATVNVGYTGGIQVGGNVTISGVTPSGYDGTYKVLSIVTNTNVTMNNASNPASGSGGTLVSGINYGAYDVYTDDPWNTTNGLGLQQGYWQSDQAAGLGTIWSELWIPAWSPAGAIGGTLNNYEGIGNCDWTTYGVHRQSLVPLSIFASANGMTEIDMFSAAYAGVLCQYGQPATPDMTLCLTCLPYAEDVATALGSATVPAQVTPLFYVLQNLIRWFPVVAGQQLPI